MDIFGELEEKILNDEIIDLNTMKKLKFESIKEFYRVVKNSKKCIFPNCENRSIKQSHTIQKSGSLTAIASESHLLHPTIDEPADELRMKMERIGIGDATTFPGFCTRHEEMFSEFENKKDIDSVEAAKLQAYRSICREIVINQIKLERVKKSILKYKNARNRQAQVILQNKTSKKLKSAKITYDDYRLNYAKMGKNQYKKKLKSLTTIHDKFLASIKDEEDDNIFMHVLKIDMKFPVALSGLGYAGILESENNIREIKSVFNVIPFESSTVFVFGGNIVDADILERHFKSVTQHPLLILNFIESFMMHGTDHWYINPEIWDVMDEKKQKFILEYLILTENSYLQDIEFSIFDGIRRKLLAEFPIPESFKENEIRKLNFKFSDHKKTLMDSMDERYNDYYSK